MAKAKANVSKRASRAQRKAADGRPRAEPQPDDRGAQSRDAHDVDRDPSVSQPASDRDAPRSGRTNEEAVAEDSESRRPGGRGDATS